MPILPEHKELLSSQSESKTLPEQKKWLIYLHLNTVNGKVYVGQTCQTLKQRWNSGHGYDTQPLFHKAIVKYGPEAFKHYILEDNISTQAMANERERYYISYYHSYINDDNCNGYNLTPGGDTCEEQLELAHLGWQKWRQNNPEAYSDNVKKMQLKRTQQCSIPVWCEELQQYFTSAGEASRQTGADQSGITKCCKNKQKTAGGYHWRYYEKR